MARIGLVGLGTMGAALALNIAEKEFAVAVHNRTAEVTDRFMARAGDLGARITRADDPDALAAALDTPRAVIVMVKAGGAVDAYYFRAHIGQYHAAHGCGPDTRQFDDGIAVKWPH